MLRVGKDSCEYNGGGNMSDRWVDGILVGQEAVNGRALDRYLQQKGNYF